MINRVLIVLLLFMSPSCMASNDVMDPTGVWSSTMTWTAGDCGFSGSSPMSITVVRIGSSYALDEHQSVTGQVTCTSDRCRVEFTETGLVGMDAVTIKVDLTAVDDTSQITGAGNAAVARSTGGSCRQDFLVAGRLLR